MTFLVTLVALSLAYGHWLLKGSTLLPWVTVFEAAYAAGVLTAVIYAIRSGERRAALGAIILSANWGASLFAWSLPDPVSFSIATDIITATWFALWGQARWEYGLAALFAFSGLAGVGTWAGAVPAAYGGSFIEWSFPSLTSVMGHLANVTLGMGAGDAGKRVRRVLGVRPLMGSVGGYLRARLRGRAEGLASEATEDQW